MSGTGDPQPIAFRKVSGVVHVMMVQNCCHGSGGSGFSSVWEYTDPGSYSTTYATAPQGAFIRDWGQDGGGSAYDMWHGLPGQTVCTTANASVWSCTPGTTVAVGSVAGVGSNWAVKGAFFHDDGSGHCCFFLTYGQQYATYASDSNVVMADLIGQANVNSYGPFRTCAGLFGSGQPQTCGPMRGFDFWDAPDGSMGVGGATGAWQQSTDNKGPSAFWGASWITASTPQGFGSTRGGNSNYRTTDIVEPSDGLALYTLDSNINCDGTIISGPNISFRRTTDANFGNYSFEGIGPLGGPCGMEEIDPLQYSGIGSWSSVDNSQGSVWVNTSPKSGYIVGATLSTGHTWYKTDVTFATYAKGAGTEFIFQRNADEALACTAFANVNADQLIQVKPAFYTSVLANAASIKFLNPGTPNQSISVTHSGNAVTVHLATNGSSASTSTANQVATAIANDGFASTVFSLSTGAVCSLGTSDGTGVVDTITNAANLSGSQVPAEALVAGVLTPAGGAEWCPLHNVNPGFNNTGPVSTDWEPALIVYSTSQLLAAPGSGNPDYSLDPQSTIFLRNIYASMQFTPNIPPVDAISGVWFDYATNKLYVAAPAADRGSVYFGLALPLIHVFQVATSAPAPVPIEIFGSLGLLTVLALPRRRAK